jgi:hypothetical protein
MSLPESTTRPLGGVKNGVHSVTSLVVQVGRNMTPNDVREKMGFNGQLRDTVRIISVRRSREKEVKYYESTGI